MVCINPRDAADAGEWVTALANEFRLTRSGEQIRHDVDLLRPDSKVHGTADRGNGVCRTRRPIGEVAALRHLKGTEDAHVKVTAAHHRKRISVVEVRSTQLLGHRLLAGVDEVGIDTAQLWFRPHTEHSVLRVEDHFDSLWQEIRDTGGGADAQVHDCPLGDVTCNPGGELVPADSCGHAAPPSAVADPTNRPFRSQARSPTATTRST